MAEQPTPITPRQVPSASLDTVLAALMNLAASLDALYWLLTRDQPPSPPSNPERKPPRYLIATGALALDLWQPDDEIHLACMSSNSSRIFWHYVAEKLHLGDHFRAPVSEVCRLPSDVLHRTPPQARREGVYLHYCAQPPDFDHAAVHAYGFPDYTDSARRNSPMALNLRLVRDTWQVIHTLRRATHMDIFRTAYTRLRTWAQRNGVWSRSFGMLDADILLWLLFDAYTLAETSSCQFNALCLVRAFFARYTRRLSLPGRVGLQPPLHNLSLDGEWSIITETVRASRTTDLMELDDLLCPDPSPSDFHSFLGKFRIFITATAESWSPSATRQEAFFRSVESTLAALPKEVRRTTDLQCWWQPWPYPIQSPKNSEERIWIFPVPMRHRGLSQGPEYMPLDGEDFQLFLRLMKESMAELGSAEGVVDVQVCSRDEIEAFMFRAAPTRRPREAEYVPGLEPHRTAQLVPTPQGTMEVRKKLRPASAVLSRLRWDPAHAGLEYEVGYLDRFEGLKWVRLEDWGRQTEEEDFIPEHRVRLMRRKGEGGEEGTIVWDRERRVDLTDG